MKFPYFLVHIERKKKRNSDIISITLLGKSNAHRSFHAFYCCCIWKCRFCAFAASHVELIIKFSWYFFFHSKQGHTHIYIKSLFDDCTFDFLSNKLSNTRTSSLHLFKDMRDSLNENCFLLIKMYNVNGNRKIFKPFYHWNQYIYLLFCGHIFTIGMCIRNISTFLYIISFAR